MSKNILMVTAKAPDESPFFLNEKRPPLGVLSLISVLRNAWHKVFFIDNYTKPTNFIEDGFIQKHKIDFVGIYCSTVCWRDCQHMIYKLDFLRRRHGCKFKIIIGGPHTSVSKKSFPEPVDFVVKGEGEEAILNIIETGKHYSRIEPRIKNLNHLPFPAYDLVMGKPEYTWDSVFFSQKPVVPLNTSRGCPFGCTFCSVQGIWGNHWTSFSARRIVDDIKKLISMGAMAIYFREDNFTVDKKRVTDVCNLLIQEKVNIPWACESRTSNLTKALLMKMKSAGCQGLFIGVESGSMRMLKKLNKNIPLKKTKDIFRYCKELRIKTATTFMYGLPGETVEDIRDSQHLINTIVPSIYWPCVFVGQPGSPLYEELLERKGFDFIDDRGLMYLKGHNENVRNYYRHNPKLNSTLHPIHNAKPLVSVIMAAKDVAPYIERAILSVLRQTYPKFELLIYNDGSKDNTLHIINRLALKDKRIVVFDGGVAGQTAVKTFLINRAKGKYIAIMDADDISLPNRFEVGVDFLEKNPSYAVVGSSYYQIDDSQHDRIFSFVPVKQENNDIKQGLKQQNWFGNSSTMIRRSCFVEVGGYDPTFKFAQDYDLWVRLSKKYKLANLGYPYYCYRRRAKAVSSVSRAEQIKFAEMARRKA